VEGQGRTVILISHLLVYESRENFVLNRVEKKNKKYKGFGEGGQVLRVEKNIVFRTI